MKFTSALASTLLALPALAADSSFIIPGATLGFQGGLFVAQRLSVAAAGGSGEPRLWSAEAISYNGAPVKSAGALSNVTAHFIINKKGSSSLVEIESSTWGTWGKPTVTDAQRGIMGADTFKIPLPVELEDAEKTFRKATGSKALIQSVELYEPVLRDSPDQPAYYFRLTDGKTAVVGAQDGEFISYD